MLMDGYAGDLEEKQQMFVRTAYESNEKQLSIINSILKTAQIDSGTYKVVKVPQNLLALVETVFVDFAPVLLMRKQLLVCTISEDIVIMVDRAEMCVAIANIIENASKYSPNGTTISISASQSQKLTTVRIKDQGVGIEEADQQKIFEKFTRVSNILSDTVDGSGLGLYWTKRVITMHGGIITVKSSLGHGTTFIIKLPI